MTDKPTTRCGVMSGKKFKLIPKYNVAGIRMTPPPNPTSDPSIPAQSAMTARSKYSIKIPLRKDLIVSVQAPHILSLIFPEAIWRYLRHGVRNCC